jgi:alkylation response protein AidB-like acyl-CoA dehydrogenase
MAGIKGAGGSSLNKPLTLAAYPSQVSGEPELEVAKDVARLAFANAAECDRDGGFPEKDVAELGRCGLLLAPLPRRFGGSELGGLKLSRTLRTIGAGSLALGRLYEGHVNAVGLVLRYGAAAQIERMATELRRGELLGVWNTDEARVLRLVGPEGRLRLEGRKILASGAGWIDRPLVTATDERGRRLMVMPRLDAERADLSKWTAQGMRASATGAVDLTGLSIEPIDILGEDGDYERQPHFTGGAWRFCAVQLGGMETLLELLRQHLLRTGRGGDAHQAARLGEAGIAVETARLWVTQAARTVEEGEETPDRIVSYVNLCRTAIERAGLALMEIVHRSVGLQSFMRPNPIERVSRDLATYLRQPAPDHALTSAAACILAQGGDSLDLWT